MVNAKPGSSDFLFYGPRCDRTHDGHYRVPEEDDLTTKLTIDH